MSSASNLNKSSTSGPTDSTTIGSSTHLDMSQILISKENDAQLAYAEYQKNFLQTLKDLPQRGKIELIMGPMFAGKSTELIRRIQRLEICDKKVLKIKFKMDDRYSQECISTHDSKKTKARSCLKLSEVGETWRNFDVIAVDEGQFFDDLVPYCEKFAHEGKIVLISALSCTFLRSGFPNITELIPMCEKVTKLNAICKQCKHSASFHYRKADEGNSNLIGGEDMYMPLCRECFTFKMKIADKGHLSTQFADQKLKNKDITIRDPMNQQSPLLQSGSKRIDLIAEDLDSDQENKPLQHNSNSNQKKKNQVKPDDITSFSLKSKAIKKDQQQGSSIKKISPTGGFKIVKKNSSDKNQQGSTASKAGQTSIGSTSYQNKVEDDDQILKETQPFNSGNILDSM